MKFTCPSCQTTYNLDEKRIPPGGAKLKCAKCQTSFPVKLSASEPEAVPLPGNDRSPPASDPFGFDGGAQPAARSVDYGFDAPAESGAVPLSGGNEGYDAGAIPLPGGEAAHDESGAYALPPSNAEVGFGDQVSAPFAMPAIEDQGALPVDDGYGAEPYAAEGSTATAIATPPPEAAAESAPEGGFGDTDFEQPTRMVDMNQMSNDAYAQAGEEAIPLPGEAPPPMPFDAPTGPYPAEGDSDFDQPTRMVPVPEEMAAPVPIEEAAPAHTDFDFGEAVPLPGDSGSYAEEPVPLAAASDFVGESAQVNDGGFAAPPPVDDPFGADPGFEESTRVVPNAGEMAGLDAPPVDAFALAPPAPESSDDADFDQPTRVGTIPAELFGDSPEPSAPAPFAIPSVQPLTPAMAPLDAPLDAPAFGEDADFDQPTRVGTIPAELFNAAPGALPLPAAQAPAFEIPSVQPLTPGEAGYGEATQAEEVDFDQPTRVMSTEAIASAAIASSLGNSAVAPDDPFAAISSSVNEAAAPPAPATPAFQLDDLPTAAGPDPFAAVSSETPAADDPFAAIDTGSAPAPAPARPAPAPLDLATDFGGVDLGGDPAPAEPSSPPSASGDDPFASVALHDDAQPQKAASSGRRLQVRRRSGKVFGPFDEGALLKMLEDGQLLGNEDVSTDGSSWSPIGSVANLAQAAQKAAEQSKGQSGASDETLERLRQMYGGRMATVSVVESKDYLGAVKSKAKYIAIAAGIAVVLGGGLSLGFTRYGVFGLKRLMPSKVSAGTPAYVQLEAAKKALLGDTFKGYKDARATTAKLLALNEYPEVRAVWCQSIFYLQRRYAAAAPGEIAQAKAALEEITVLGGKNAEVAKALAGAALAEHKADQAAAILTEAINRDATNDPELTLLAAEADDQKGQTKDAISTLERLIARHPESVKAQHALGDLYQDDGNADKAEKAYQKALSLSSAHVSSAVELAAVELLVRKDLDKADTALKSALDGKTLEQLGPAEVARGRALEGVLHAERFQYPEAQKSLEEALHLDPGSIFIKANLGRVLLAQHAYDQALPLFKEASEKDPRNLAYTDGYLSALIATGKMSDALAAVGNASARFPNNARIAFLSARVNDALGHGLDAEKAYKRAVAADPKLFEANLYLGRFYLRAKRFADAQEQMDAAAKLAPDSAAVQAGVGELSLAKDHAADAKAQFEKSAKLEPTLADAHLGLARALYVLGDAKEAKVEADKALELDAHIQDGHLTAGEILWKLGDLDGALAELTKAKADSPNSNEVAIATGIVKYDKGDFAGAESSLLIALSNDPVNSEAHYQLARVKNAQGQYTQAIDQMKDALDHTPKRPDYHYEMGVILRASKDVSGAIQEWQQAVQLDPKNADSLEALGQVYLDQGRFDDAVKSCEEALKADKTRTRIIGLEGDAYFQSTHWKEAIDRYQKALAQDPKLTPLYYKIGRAFGEQGNSVEAIRWYQKATGVDPQNAMPYYYLGYAFKEKGKKKDAIDAFKEYLAKKPGAPDKKDIEDEIYDLQQP
jgi:predicted Zn finger-like uncharacterized protein